MDRQAGSRSEKLIEIGSRELEDKISEVDATLLPRQQEFTDWIGTTIAAKQLAHLDPEARTYERILSFLVELELTHDLRDWIARWNRTASDLKRPPVGRIEELQEKYAGIAEAEGWADEVEDTCATPDLHEIIQRGFQAQNEGDDETPILSELRAFIAEGGDLEKRDNSRMTGLQRCKMLGWREGRKVLEQCAEESAAA